jgi:tetratricopeptide (TPR) repeat protein
MAVAALLSVIVLSADLKILAQESLPDTVASVKPSVVLIVTYNSAGKPLAAGSGFCIAAGRIVTNNHVITGAVRITIRLATGGTYAVKRVSVADKELDLAILETGLDISQIAPLQLTSALPREGERLFVVSNPEGLSGSVSDGIVSAIRRFADGSILVQITAPISHGSSGGPVLNMKGQVIGVAVGSFKAGQNLNFMIPSAAVARLSARISASAASVPKIEPKNLPSEVTVKIEPMPTFPKPEIRERTPAEARRLYAEGVRIRKLKFIGKEQTVAKLQAAISFLESALQVDPKLSQAWGELGQTEWRLANLRHDKVLEAKATATLKKAIELAADPNDLEAMRAYAESLYYLDRFDEAILIRRQIVNSKESEFGDYRKLVEALNEASRDEEALSAARETIRRFPNDPQAWEQLGSAYGHGNQRGEQIAALKKAVGLAPERSSTHLGLGSAYYQGGRYEEATQAYSEAIRLEPGASIYYVYLGEACLKLGRYREALDAFGEAVRLDPNSPDRQERLADFYSDLGYYQRAVEIYRRALQLSTGINEGSKPRLHYSLGKCYLDLGNRAAARNTRS